MFLDSHWLFPTTCLSTAQLHYILIKISYYGTATHLPNILAQSWKHLYCTNDYVLSCIYIIHKYLQNCRIPYIILNIQITSLLGVFDTLVESIFLPSFEQQRCIIYIIGKYNFFQHFFSFLSRKGLDGTDRDALYQCCISSHQCHISVPMSAIKAVHQCHLSLLIIAAY